MHNRDEFLKELKYLVTISKKANQIADSIVPEYRAPGSNHSCTGHVAKRWTPLMRVP